MFSSSNPQSSFRLLENLNELLCTPLIYNNNDECEVELIVRYNNSVLFAFSLSKRWSGAFIISGVEMYIMTLKVPLRVLKGKRA